MRKDSWKKLTVRDFITIKAVVDSCLDEGEDVVKRALETDSIRFLEKDPPKRWIPRRRYVIGGKKYRLLKLKDLSVGDSKLWMEKRELKIFLKDEKGKSPEDILDLSFVDYLEICRRIQEDSLKVYNKFVGGLVKYSGKVLFKEGIKSVGRVIKNSWNKIWKR